MPEAQADSTHFRFSLSGLVLFVVTFILNTTAEMVRQRLRAKYSLSNSPCKRGSRHMQQFKERDEKGEPGGMNAAAVSISLIMVVGLLGLIAVARSEPFRPHAIMEATYVQDGSQQTVLGEIADDTWVRNARLKDMGITPVASGGLDQVLIKRGNREISGKFCLALAGHKMFSGQRMLWCLSGASGVIFMVVSQRSRKMDSR